MPEPYIELRPFTTFDPKELGVRIQDLVRQNEVELEKDFDSLIERYGTATSAERNVEQACTRMQHLLGYEALAVCLGRTPGDAEVQGVAAYEYMGYYPEDDHLKLSGPHLSVWLNKNRPDYLRRIGPPLMEHRMQRIIDNPHAYGRPWALVRSANLPSIRTWEYRGYSWGGFKAVESPRPYPSLTSNMYDYTLYTATQSLKNMRRELRCDIVPAEGVATS